MNILVITRGSWNVTNNTGNTLEKLFCEMKNCNIYNLFMRDEEPNNTCSICSYQISEQELIKHFWNNKNVGQIYEENEKIEKRSQKLKEKKMYSQAKKTKSYVPWFIREMIWSKSNWKNNSLSEFINDINPDVIFMPSFNCWYPYKVLLHICKLTKAKVILYHVDDNFSLKQYSISPLFWIYRFVLRKWIKKSIKISSSNYCISELQIKEYEKYFKKKFLLLHKGFKKIEEQNHTYNEPLKLVYTGNLSSGRWKTLAKIGKALDYHNEKNKKMELDIYSGTELTEEMEKVFRNISSINFQGCISATEVYKVQKRADILLHVESFDLKEKLEVRLSFSTKIIDYLNMGKCVLAVGPADIASIQYFIVHDVGFVISNQKDIVHEIIKLFDKDFIENKRCETLKFVNENCLNNEEMSEMLYGQFLSIMRGVE